MAQRWRVAGWCVIALGIFLRIFHFAANRSLWEDEVFLSSSLVRMNFRQLAVMPLDYQQRAPLGFLWAVKLIVNFLGKQEMQLRLFSLLGGITALFAFRPVARYFLKPVGAFVALAILALAPPLIYHSVEVKQYGTEMLATVLSLLLYVKYNGKTDGASLLKWGLGGAVILWFSFSALFILSGIACSVCLYYLLKKDRKRFVRSLLPFGLWLFSFALVYVLFVSRYHDEPWLNYFWQNRKAFAPFPPKTLNDLAWPFIQLYSFIHYPLGLSWFELDYLKPYSSVVRILARMPLLPVVFLIAGFISFWKKDRRLLLVLSFPLLVAVVASGLKLYPLHERLSLFLAPLVILFVARGCDSLWNTQRFAPAFKYLLLVLLLAAPVANDARQAVDVNYFGEYKKSYQREVLLYLDKQFQPGDIVYVYWNDLPGYKLYENAYNLGFDAVEGRDVRLLSNGFTDYFQRLAPDFDQLKGKKRVWVIYRNFNGMKIGDFEGRPEWYYKDVDAVAKFHDQLASMGKEISTYDPTGKGLSDIHLSLFDLSQ